MPNRTSPFKAYLSCSTDFAAGDVPEWIQLLPSGELTTVDGRLEGAVPNPQKIVLCSFDGLDRVDKVVVDINHSNAVRASSSETPAVGWLCQLEARNGETWGRVEWNKLGTQAIADKHYRGISAEVMVNRNTGEILGIRAASLTNIPNIKRLTPVFNNIEVPKEKDDMKELLALLNAALGLGAEATADKAIEQVKSLVAKSSAATAEMQKVNAALGLEGNGGLDAVLNAIKAKSAAGKSVSEEALAALRAELQTVTNELATSKKQIAGEKAEAYLDGEIKKGRPGVKALKDHYRARMMNSQAEFDAVKKEVEALPLIGPGAMVMPSPAKEGEASLTQADLHFCKITGTDPEAFKKARLAEQTKAAA